MQTSQYMVRILVTIAVCAVFAGCQARDGLMLTANAAEETAKETQDTVAEQATEEFSPADPEESAPPVKRISVHVCGAVKCAGVVEIPEDARVLDAVNAAGGFSEDADTEAVNLAAFLVDGCRLRIPCVSETGETDEAGEIPAVMTVGIDAHPADSLVVLADGIAAQDNKINLNTATAEELCTLNGIGPKRASDIIRYREEHGGFSNIEEVMNVNGIKQNLFAKIRDYIRV